MLDGGAADLGGEIEDALPRREASSGIESNLGCRLVNGKELTNHLEDDVAEEELIVLGVTETDTRKGEVILGLAGDHKQPLRAVGSRKGIGDVAVYVGVDGVGGDSPSREAEEGDRSVDEALEHAWIGRGNLALKTGHRKEVASEFGSRGCLKGAGLKHGNVAWGVGNGRRPRWKRRSESHRRGGGAPNEVIPGRLG